MSITNSLPGELIQYEVNWPPSLLMHAHERRIWVWLPDDYKSGDKHFPVLFMHDGQNVFLDSDATFGTCWQMIDAQMQLPEPMIVVAIEGQNDGLKRFGEFSPWVNAELAFWKGMKGIEAGGLADDYLAFVTGTIVPSIHRDFRCLKQPESNWLGGSSMGGFVSLYAATKYESIFGRYIAMSTATWFHHDLFIAAISSHEFSPSTRIYADIGTQETSNEDVKEFPQIYLDGNKALFNVLESKLPPQNFMALVDDGAVHNESAWAQRLPAALRFLNQS